jgi:hypothetical protein
MAYINMYETKGEEWCVDIRSSEVHTSFLVLLKKKEAGEDSVGVQDDSN